MTCALRRPLGEHVGRAVALPWDGSVRSGLVWDRAESAGLRPVAIEVDLDDAGARDRVTGLARSALAAQAAELGVPLRVRGGARDAEPRPAAHLADVAETELLERARSRGFDGALHEPLLDGPLFGGPLRLTPNLELDPGPAPLQVQDADPAADVARALVEGLWRFLGPLYGDTGPCRFRPEDVSGPGSAFVVARLHGRPVGCGALLPFDAETWELKRMYVEDAARRRGLARAILAGLERRALALGARRVRLETGRRQAAALALYGARGYAPVPCWGRFAADPESRCLERALPAPAGAAVRRARASDAPALRLLPGAALEDGDVGWVATCEGRVAGAARVDPAGAQLVALRVHPRDEGRGLGGALLERATARLAARQLHDPRGPTPWLAVAPGLRAAELVLRAGWRPADEVRGGPRTHRLDPADYGLPSTSNSA